MSIVVSYWEVLAMAEDGVALRWFEDKVAIKATVVCRLPIRLGWLGRLSYYIRRSQKVEL